MSHKNMSEGAITGSIDVDELAQEIRRIDGSNSLGAGALAEALLSFINARGVRGAITPKDLQEAFYEGYNSRSTYNDVDLSDVDSEWATSDARLIHDAATAGGSDV